MAYDIMKMAFSKLYDLYLDKVERKGRTKEELDSVICWLSGFDQSALKKQLAAEVSVGDFVDGFPKLHENANLVTGSICGVKVQEISDTRMKRVRLLDKLVDELAQGKPLDKILRKTEDSK